MPSESIEETVSSYMRGDLGVDEAAATIFRLQKGGGGFNLHMTDLETVEKGEALMGRLLWLVLRETDAQAVPDTPFGAAEFREFQRQTKAEIEDDEGRHRG